MLFTRIKKETSNLSNEEEAIVILLHLNEIFNRSEIISEMQIPR